MGQVAKTNEGSTQLIRWSAPSLDDRLSALLDGYTSLATAPVIGPKSAAALQQFMDAAQDWPQPTRSDVERMLALLATVKRRRQNAPSEAEAQIELYWHGLRDVPLDDLRHAYEVLLKASPWFPDISEIRQSASEGPVARVRRRVVTAGVLLMKHRQEWQAPKTPATPEEIAAAKKLTDEFLGRTQADAGAAR